MKKIFIVFALILSVQFPVFAIQEAFNYKTFTNEKGLWGLKDEAGNVLIEPQYKKLIALGSSSYIVQKRSKFGLVDPNNKVLVPIKYFHAERMLGKYLKIGTGSKYALYNEKGEELLPPEYSSINLLFGQMFLTCKNYKYGIIDYSGNTVLGNIFDDIYMPKPNIIRIKYSGQWYEIEQIKGGTLQLPEDMKHIKENKNYIVTTLTEHPADAVKYSAVTFTDYFLKLFSSISPAHEKTIDTLMLYQGADAVTIYLKLSWIPKYPFVFAKNYFDTVRNPNNGPLSDIKSSLKSKTGEQ